MLPIDILSCVHSILPTSLLQFGYCGRGERPHPQPCSQPLGEGSRDDGEGSLPNRVNRLDPVSVTGRGVQPSDLAATIVDGAIRATLAARS